MFFASPAAAVGIQFQNCLSDEYRADDLRTRDPNDHPGLQLVPHFAEASLKKSGRHHSLSFMSWFNVTGQYNRGPDLPDSNDAYWRNVDENNGKIADSENGVKGTTLIRRVRALSYEPLDQGVLFCSDGLVNGTCPLAPVFNGSL